MKTMNRRNRSKRNTRSMRNTRSKVNKLKGGIWAVDYMRGVTPRQLFENLLVKLYGNYRTQALEKFEECKKDGLSKEECYIIATKHAEYLLDTQNDEQDERYQQRLKQRAMNQLNREEQFRKDVRSPSEESSQDAFSERYGKEYKAETKRLENVGGKRNTKHKRR